MSKPLDIAFIRAKIRHKKYIIDPQHVLQLHKYGVNMPAMEQVILTGTIIETHPHNLILGFANDLPIHVACSYWAEEDTIYIHTVYIPDDRWMPDYKTRKWKR